MLMHLALLDDLLVDLSLRLGAVSAFLLLGLIEAGEVEALVGVLEVLVLFVGAEVDIVELFEVGDLLAAVGESVGGLVFEECELGGAL